MKYVFGHKNPDTDTICSAIALAELRNSKPVRLGELNPETKFVLEYFQVQEPELVEDVSDKDVIVVDHTETKQSADGIEKANIVEIVDHHKLGDIQSKDQLYVRIEPVGSTATIIAKMFKENNKELTEKTAGLLFSAILSDTVIFKSATSTKEDKEIAEELGRRLGLDPMEFGMQLKKAKSDISSKTDRELIESDMKVFDSINTIVGQIEVVDDVSDRKQGLLEEMEKIKQEKNVDRVLMMLTNIIKEDTELLVVGDKELVEKAFKTTVENNSIYLKDVMSRKKQIIPPLENANVS